MKVDVKKVKKHWNSVSDSDWYMSLRTDERILKIQENPALAFLIILRDFSHSGLLWTAVS